MMAAGVFVGGPSAGAVTALLLFGNTIDIGCWRHPGAGFIVQDSLSHCCWLIRLQVFLVFCPKSQLVEGLPVTQTKQLPTHLG